MASSGIASCPSPKKTKAAASACCQQQPERGNILPKAVCPICFCECGDTPLTTITLPCGHKYHTMCFKRYMEHSGGRKLDCALCREKWNWKTIVYALGAGDAAVERFVEELVLTGLGSMKAIVSSTVTRCHYRILPTSIAAGMAQPRALRFLRSKGAKFDPVEAGAAFCHQLVARNRDRDEAAMLETAQELTDVDLDQFCAGVARRQNARMGHHPRLFGVLESRGGDKKNLALQAARCENPRALVYALGGQFTDESLRMLVDSATRSETFGVLLYVGWSKEQWKEVASAKLRVGGELRFVLILEKLAEDGCLL